MGGRETLAGTAGILVERFSSKSSNIYFCVSGIYTTRGSPLSVFEMVKEPNSDSLLFTLEKVGMDGRRRFGNRS